MSDDVRQAAVIAEMMRLERQAERDAARDAELPKFGADRTAAEDAEIARLTSAPTVDTEVQRLLDQGF